MLGSETFRQQTKLSYSTHPNQKTELLMTAINLFFTCHHSIKHNFKGDTQLLIWVRPDAISADIPVHREMVSLF